MTEENRIILGKRAMSLTWRACMMLLALGIDFLLENLGLFDLSPDVVIVLGLILGEVSKWLNTPRLSTG